MPSTLHSIESSGAARNATEGLDRDHFQQHLQNSYLNESSMPASTSSPDAIGLDRSEIKKLLGMTLEVPADSVHLALGFTPEPVLVITFTTNIGFNAIRANHIGETIDSVTIFSGEDDEKQTFDVTVENYGAHFFPPIPIIRSLDGQLFDKGRTGEIRLQSTYFKDKEEKKELESLMKRGMNFDLATKLDLAITLKRFNVIRKYQFNVPMTHFNTCARQFPTDIHRLVLGIEFQSIRMYVNDMENPSDFELKIPVVTDGKRSIKIKGNLTKTQDYHLDMIEVLEWTSTDEEKVTESILEFDIQRKSFHLERCNPRIPVTKNISARISFNLVRYVLGPALTLLVPIYVVTLLIPFCSFFDPDSYSDIAGYLSSLLLTLVAHRQLIDQKQQSVLVITKADVDFFFGILFVLLQMIVFIALPSLLNFDQRFRLYLFILEEVIVLMWILMRVAQFYEFGLQNDILNSQNLLNQTDLLPVREYCSLRCHRKEFTNIIPTREVHIKTFFSLNMKLLIHQRSQKEQSGEHRFPTCDMFRMRINRIEVATFLQKSKDKRLKLLYTKPIIKGHLCKMVFQCSRLNNEIPLEVQILEDGKDAPSPNGHIKYKKEKLQKELNAFNKLSTPDTSFHDMLWLLLRSIFIECTSYDLSFRQRLKHIRTDYQLFRAINEVLKNIVELKKSELELKKSELTVIETSDESTGVPGGDVELLPMDAELEKLLKKVDAAMESDPNPNSTIVEYCSE